jgi:hypothetical protein
MQSLAAHLDDVMAQAEIAANAERDLGAETPTAPSMRQEAPAAPAEEEAESEEPAPGEEPQEGDDGEGDTEGEEEEAGEPTPAPAQAQTEPPKLGRRAAVREAERLSSELERSKKEAAELKAAAERFRGEVSALRASDQTIRNHLQKESGYVREPNGRYRYENLSEKVLKGSASPEEQEEVARMTSWHEFAAPIFRAAEEMVLGSFKADWTTVKDLEGIGDDGLSKLNTVPSTVDAVREVHARAYAAGQAKAKAESQARIARLQAEVKSLRTGVVARAPQPAAANGAAVPAKGGFLQRAIGPDGLSNPDFDREVAAGKWLGVDLAQT